jgi:cytochrome c5
MANLAGIIARLNQLRIIHIMSNEAHLNSQVSLFQKIIIILGGIITPIFVLYTMTKSPSVAENPAEVIDVAANIKPLAVVEVAAESGTSVEMSGEAIVAASCAACHASGVLNSPKIGDAAAWQARIALGFEMLTKHAIEGVRTMPARGGNPDLTDNEVAKAVAHMANQSGASFTLAESVEAVQ